MSGAADSEASDTTFGKDKRLLNATDYRRVFDRAEAKASHKHLLLLARKSDRPGHRLGLVIAKKNIRLAAQRNRVKRIAREVFRQLPPGEASLDVILLARRGMDQLDNSQLSTILRQQWQKLLRHNSDTDSSHSRKA